MPDGCPRAPKRDKAVSSWSSGNGPLDGRLAGAIGHGARNHLALSRLRSLYVSVLPVAYTQCAVEHSSTGVPLRMAAASMGAGEWESRVCG
jgi:hypothetical protein